MSARIRPPWIALGKEILPPGDSTPKVMGIVNLTPDSFSDGRPGLDLNAALEQARRMASDGADLLDIGGESSRPGASAVALDEELRRVFRLVETLARELTIPLSVDTTKAGVARAALAVGASVINDITALRGDPAMRDVIAGSEAGVVLMHMQGTPATMQLNPCYEDVLSEIYDFLARRVDIAVAGGIARERIAVDPGIGFGKTFEHNLTILHGLRRFENLGCAILIGTSRKGFLGTITGRLVSARESASVASALAACVEGARVVRVHDVAATVDAIKVWSIQRGWGDST